MIKKLLCLSVFYCQCRQQILITTAIPCNATSFDITLSHFTRRHTICVYAVPFNIMLSHLMQLYTVYMYAVPFKITLSHFTQRYTVCVYAVLLAFFSCSNRVYHRKIGIKVTVKSIVVHKQRRSKGMLLLEWLELN